MHLKQRQQQQHTSLTAIFQVTRVSQYQNVSILDFIGAKDDGGAGDNWSYKSYKAPVKSSSSTNQQPAFYRLNAKVQLTGLSAGQISQTTDNFTSS